MDEKKFRSAALYLLTRAAPARPSLVALVKLLWLSDYEHYRRHLSTITDAEYIALQNGPVVNDYKDVFAAMERDGLLDKSEVPVYGVARPKVEYQPKQEADSNLFTESELTVLDDIAATYGSWSAGRLIQKTHIEGPWKLVEQGDTIRPFLFRWLDNLPDEDALADAKARLEKRGDVMNRVRELTAKQPATA